MKRVSFVLTAILVCTPLLCSCTEAEISYPLSAYINHPIGDAITQYLSEQDAFTFPDESIEETLSEFGVEVVSKTTLRKRLGDEAEAVFGEYCTYLYVEREFTDEEGIPLLSPAVYVISTDEDRRFTASFSPEHPDGTRWNEYHATVYDILSWQYLPSDGGGYDCVALSNFAYARISCIEFFISFPGYIDSMQSDHIYTQFAPYFDDAISPRLQGVNVQNDLRLKKTTIIISGIEIGVVPLSRGRE